MQNDRHLLGGLMLAGVIGLGSLPAVAAGAEGRLSVAGITASSQRAGDFAVQRVLDGNLVSAWGPNAADSDPSLTLALSHSATLTAVSLKQSPAGARVDITGSRNGGAWQTLASGLTPQAGSLVRLDLQDTDVDRIKLTFRGVGAGSLLVCEVQPLGRWSGQANAPGSTWTPTPRPSWTPTPRPSWTPRPSAWPAGTSCLQVSGGGWVPAAGTVKNKGNSGKHDDNGKHKGQIKKQDQNRVAFSFAGGQWTDRKMKGHVRVTDLRNGRVYQGRVLQVTSSGDDVQMTGELKGQGTFTMNVRDNRGHAPRFAFSTSTGFSTAGQPGGGTIVVKQGNCK